MTKLIFKHCMVSIKSKLNIYLHEIRKKYLKIPEILVTLSHLT